MQDIFYALEATNDGFTEFVGIFDTPELAKEFAQALENESANDDDEAGDISLEWKSGQDYTGDQCERTEFDMAYSGATYKVSLVRRNPIPWRKA